MVSELAEPVVSGQLYNVLILVIAVDGLGGIRPGRYAIQDFRS